MTRAVVFAYHDVGVACLSGLLARGVAIDLVVTHEDDPEETIWFASVAALARRHGLPIVTPKTPKDPALAEQVAAIAPDLLFSFYYRRVIPEPVLRSARRGAFNMHGSLLPRYRGRAPVNWAILHGETETGATLHRMVERPDAGPVVGQERVLIRPDDLARDVFDKVTGAAARLLDRTLPFLIDGTAAATPQDESRATTFGRRRSQDGRIDWTKPAGEVHNLVRAVAPPYPGAFTSIGGGTVVIHRTLREPTAGHRATPLHLHGDGGRCFAVCGDGQTLRIAEAAQGGAPVDLEALALELADRPVRL